MSGLTISGRRDCRRAAKITGAGCCCGDADVREVIACSMIAVCDFLRTCGGKDFEYLDLDIIQLVQMEGAASGYYLVVNALELQLTK